MFPKNTVKVLIIFLSVIAAVFFARVMAQRFYENGILKKIITRLEADSRIAEVLVTAAKYDPAIKKTTTTIKFLEYDVNGKPIAPKYFTFSGNVIQFQSLVIRFKDIHVESGDSMKGKSAYLFWKAFVLDGRNTQEYEITKLYEVPDGYRTDKIISPFEEDLWKKLWVYALDQKESDAMGIKNAQIEAPGTKFIPGTLYTIRIEHDGGIRIDTQILPFILRGEKILE
ncbi:MAG TPA: hypothetical protein PKY78_02250 [Candidatus Omnitrophota bacterium]|nr:hypothetical protein [Candidatus Omnitrophota bacterium]